MANILRQDRIPLEGPMQPLPPEEELGPKMRALRLRHRLFVWALAHNGGNGAAAAAAAGYGSGDPKAEAVAAYQIRHRTDVIEAQRELAERTLHGTTTLALVALTEILADPNSKHRMKAVEAVLNRTGFQETRNININHSSEDRKTLLREIKDMAERLGMDPAQLLGENARQLEHKPAIDAEFSEHSSEGIEDLL